MEDTSKTLDYQNQLRHAKRARKAGNRELALVHYKSALLFQPGDMNAMAAMAEIELALGRFSDLNQTYLAMAEHYAHGGFRLKAIALYKKLLKLPQNVTEPIGTISWKLRLAGLYGEQGFRVRQAQIILEVAASLGQEAARFTEQALGIVSTVVDPVEEKGMTKLLGDVFQGKPPVAPGK